MCRPVVLLVLLVLLAFAGRLPAVDLPTDRPKDQDALVGTWAVNKFDTGDPAGGLIAEQLAKIKVIFKAGGILTLVQGDDKDKDSTFKLDTAATPKTIDITGDTSTALGLYELDGDLLKHCMVEGGNKRPTELKGDTKSGAVLMTLKRVKGEKKDN